MPDKIPGASDRARLREKALSRWDNEGGAHRQLRVGAIALEKLRIALLAEGSMTKRFNVGDRVSWNSEAGRVRGTIVRVHIRDVDDNGYTHRASPEIPEYESKSSKTGHIAMHLGSALSRLKV